MKKIALFLLTLLITTPFFAWINMLDNGSAHVIMEAAQMAASNRPQGHFQFRGVPIDGHLSDFVAKMKQLGYIEKVQYEEGAVIMEGTFTGRDAELYILYTPKSKTVYSVGAYLDKASSWYSLKELYTNYKKEFAKKYDGEGYSHEYFEPPYKEGDGKELKALEEEKCVYATFFPFNEGGVALNISRAGQLVIIYSDSQNQELYEAEMK